MINDDIRAAISGDATAVDRLDPDAFSQGSPMPSLGTVTLTGDAVRRVLRAVQLGEASAHQAQRWASFVRRGYVSAPDSHELVEPLAIDYELRNEDAIVEVISRLDELGDLVDGEITLEELSEMEALLRTPRSRRES